MIKWFVKQDLGLSRVISLFFTAVCQSKPHYFLSETHTHKDAKCVSSWGTSSPLALWRCGKNAVDIESTNQPSLWMYSCPNVCPGPHFDRTTAIQEENITKAVLYLNNIMRLLGFPFCVFKMNRNCLGGWNTHTHTHTFVVRRGHYLWSGDSLGYG